MNCLPCFQKDDKETHQPPQSQHTSSQPPQAAPPAATASAATSSSTAQTFTFRELAMATKNFRQECLLGEGGFGRVFKGKLQSGQVVAVKQLDRNGMQGNKEFLVEVLMLTLLQHPNLVSLIGYCADGDQRLLVYEFMPSGSLEDHLFGNGLDTKPLDWSTRMKIAAGAAKGLEYLHEKANPPIIYRDLRPSNVLLDESFNPKLSDFGLAKLGAGGGTMNVMGTYGYAAPEYSSGGELTVKSNIYSFGVVLLELISGRRAVDTTRPNNEQNLVTWAQPIFRDPKRFPDLADPSLNKQFPLKSLNQAVGIAAMCLQEEPEVRPFVSDVVSALGYLSSLPAESFLSAFNPPPEEKMEYENDKNCNSSDDEENDGESVDDDHDKEESDDHNVSYRSDAESIDKNGNGSSRKSEDVSSDNESSQTSSSSRGGKGSEPRKSVLTFKEPKLSSRERKKQSLSSSNESSSESEDESKPTRH